MSFCLLTKWSIQLFNKYILSKSKVCQTETILNMVSSTHCLQQQNEIDCGLFAISVCIHKLEEKPVGESTFMQQHITEFKQILPSLLNQKKKTIFWETVVNMFPMLNTNTTESEYGPSLLCEENLHPARSTDLLLTVERGHPSINPQVLLLNDSLDTESELDFNLQESSHIYHSNEPNKEYDITQSTKSMQKQDHSSVFIRIVSNYKLEDGTGFQSLDNVSFSRN